MHNIQDILEARDFIISKTDNRPVIGLILGSGLGTLADEIKNSVVIPYSTIPHFAKSEAIGHANELVIGELNGKIVAAMKGRFHYYEGYTLDEVTFPVRYAILVSILFYCLAHRMDVKSIWNKAISFLFCIYLSSF